MHQTLNRDDLALLERLLAARAPLMLDALALPTGAARAALQRLIARGCRIEQHPRHGVRLIEADLSVWADYIESRHRHGLGYRLLVYRHTRSTQDLARQQLLDTSIESDGHVFVADHQRAGRGRLGRAWLDRPGAALLLTAVVQRATINNDRFVLGACCAVARTVEARLNRPAQIRWPNDVLIDGKKLSGVLIETTQRHAMIGIGLNIRDTPAPGAKAYAPPLNATCLAQHGCHADRLDVLDRLLGELDHMLNRADDAQLHDLWMARSCLHEQRVRVISGGRIMVGRVVDIDPRAGLMLALDRGAVVTLPAQTTSLLPDT